MKNNAELVFIPSVGAGHIVSAIETAKLLIDRDERLSITVLVIKLPSDSKLDDLARSVTSNSSSSRLRFIDLPFDESKANLMMSPNTFILSLIDSHKANVKTIAANIKETTGLAGFVVDMFCVSMIDVANELGVPSYAYFTCAAAMLGLMFHLQTLRDDQNQDITEYSSTSSDTELVVPSFVTPVPAKVLPSVVFDKEGGSTFFLNIASRFRETKGIIINTFLELEPYAIESLTKDDGIPPIYPIGPMLNLNSVKSDEAGVILKWLDDQPLSSVVYLCFGSMGTFDEKQIKEIAEALERSGYRFLWSLRRSPPKGKIALPSDYSNPEEVLPQGFMERTAGSGKVIGWAPQVDVLSHPSVGGFVSHCGWNSTLESIWFGVPIGTWPMYAEQQTNAFELVKELGLAVEITMDYRSDFKANFSANSPVIVMADVIENGLRQLMINNGDGDGDGDGDGQPIFEKKVKGASEKSRMALKEGGSSYTSLGHLIDDIIKNNP